MNIDIFEEVSGWIAAGLSICNILPQISPFIKVLQGKLNFNDTPVLYITVYYFNSLLWFIYGKTIFNNIIKISNIVSIIICLIALGIYLIYEVRKYFLDTILNIIILSMISWGVYRYLTIKVDDEKIIGKYCLYTSIIVYLYFIYIIFIFIKEKKYDLFNYIYTYIYLLNCIFWIIYGIFTIDFYLIISYIIGIVISLIKIYIYIFFKKKYYTIGLKTSNDTIDITTIIENGKTKEDKNEYAKSIKNNIKIISNIDI